MTEQPAALREWHALVAERDAARLPALLAPDVVFSSPAIHTPQRGAEVTAVYLSAALRVLGPTLTYVHEWWDERSAALRFTATVEGLDVEGVDLIGWDADGRIVEFTVIARPFKGLQALMSAMAAELSAR